MDNLVFRIAEEADIAALEELRIAYVEADYGSIDKKTENDIRRQLEEYFPLHLNRELFAFLCLDGEDAVAVVLLYIMEKPAFVGSVSGKTGTLLNVYTRQDYRRKGIAKKLVETALEKAEQLGVDFVELQATADGEPLYRKIGFREKESRYKPMRYRFER